MKLIMSNRAEIRKRHGLDKNGDVQAYIDVQTIKECDPYVPMKSGILKQSAEAYARTGRGRVIYRTPYARRHYYNTGGVDILGRKYGPSKFNTTGAGNELRGEKWFERMKENGGAERILRGTARLIGCRYRKGNT